MSAGAERVLVDTSAWIEAIRERGDRATRARVEELVLAGQARLCDFVLLELWNGARSHEDEETLRRIEADVERVETTAATWVRARRLAREARAAGLTTPAADLLVFACAAEHGLELLHRDAHLDRLARLAPVRK